MENSYPSARRSDRIEMSIEVEAVGLDVQGRTFQESSKTSCISRYGATLAIEAKLGPGQELTLRNLRNNKDAEVHVLGLIGIKEQMHVYGIVFVDRTVDLWDVQFPSLNGEEEPVSRLVLQCRTCQRFEVSHFNEIEMQVFEANDEIRRFCRACSGPTAWKQPKPDSFEEIKKAFRLNEVLPAPAALPTTGKRWYERIATQASACIRRSDGSKEIVKCRDLSRGGLSFWTANAYLEGARLDVAAPYSSGTNNIFVPAQVVHCHKVGKEFRVGASYLRFSDLVRSYRGTSTVVE